MDWNDLKLVHAVLREGTLTGAARSLGTTQPTVGRRLAALELRVGAQLFERLAARLAPTPLARALASDLDRIEETALAVQRRLDAGAPTLSGPLLVTSLDWLGDLVVAPIAASFASDHPGVEIELWNEGRIYNLARRDADVALRFSAFEQETILQRRVADAAYALYGAPAYLELCGQVDFERLGDGHRVAVLHAAAQDAPYRDWLRATLPRAQAVLRTNGLNSHVSVVEEGRALAVLPRLVGDRHPGMVRLAAPTAPPAQPIRLGVHPETGASPRVRAFVDFAARELAALRPSLDPGGA